MSATVTEQDTAAGALASQAMFEATFPQGHTPKIDVRLPADVSWPARTHQLKQR